jgi:hypothetical protein
VPYVFQETQVGEPRPASEFASLPSEVYEETFAQAFEENPIASLYRAKQLGDDYRSSGKRLDFDSATQRLKDRGMEGDIKVSEAGITEAALDTLIYRKGVERRRQEVFGQAEGGLGQGAARLGVALGTSLIDPVNVATAFIPVIGEARYTGMLARAGSTLGRVGVRAGVGAVEGVAGAALIEPIIAGSRRYEQADYDMADSLLNVAFGGVFGAGLHSVGGAIGDGVRYHRGTEPAWKGLEGVKADEIPLVQNLRQEIARGMDARDVARVTDTWSPEARRAVEADTRAVTPAEAAHQALPPQVRENALKQAIIQAVSDEPVNVQHVIGSFPQQAGSDVVTALRHATREVNIGGERITADDPVAADVLRSRDIGALSDELKKHGITKVRPLAGGASSVVLDAGDRVVRLGTGDLKARADIPEMLQAQASGTVGNIRYEILPKADLANITDVDVADMSAALSRRGYSFSDPGADNLGRVNGRMAVLDPGAVSKELKASVDYADKVLARETDTGTPTADALKMATDEASLAQSDLKAVADRLGLEAEDAELRDVMDAANNSERWAKAAELATICLTRGG